MRNRVNTRMWSATTAALAAALVAFMLSSFAAVAAGPDATVSVASAASPASGAFSQTPEILPLDKVVPGMKGVGLTVFHGQTVEEFPVEILGRLRNQVAGGDLLLVRVGGRAVEEAGGIAAGMSGSPVYVDGKLVGAISYGMGLADHTLGLVTPIEQMLAVMQTAREKAAEGGTATGGTAVTPEATVSPEARRAMSLGSRWDVIPPVTIDGKRLDHLTVREASTPVLVSGLDPRAMDWLNRSWRTRGLGLTAVAAAAGGGAATDAGAGLQPGSAIGIGLMRGDVEVVALGTLTYRDGDDFVALGHPLLSKGSVDLIATGADILATVKSLDTPFKIGSPTDTVGRVTEDRSWAVAGSFGAPPRTIPLTAVVTDRDRDRDGGSGRVTTVKAAAVDDPDLAGTLLGAAALEALDRGIDRIGKGTARVTFTLESSDLPGGRLVRENTFYSQTDVSAAGLGEFLEGLDLVLNNEFQAVNLSSVSVTAEVSTERKTATVEKAVLKNPEAPVHPGDQVPLLVTLRPWRGSPETKEIVVSLPENIQPGRLQVTVRAGGNEYYESAEGAPAPEKAKPKPGQPQEPPVPGEQAPAQGGGKGTGKYASLDELIRNFVERERNTDLVAEFYPTTGDGEVAPGEGAPTVSAPAGDEGTEGQTAPSSVNGDGGQARIMREGLLPAAEQNPIPPEVTEREKKPGAASAQPAGEEKPIRSVLPTEYVLDGLVFVDVEVVAADTAQSDQTP